MQSLLICASATAGPGSAQASSEANRTTESAASSSEVGTTVVSVSVTQTLRGSKRTRAAQKVYISIAEIIDISSLVSSSLVRVIDLRDFVSIWCGISLDLTCVTDTKLHSSVSKSLNQCGSLMAGLHGSIEKCIYAVNEDCRTTVWTYNEDGHGDDMLDSFQPDEKLKQKKKISYVRRRKNVFKTLGPGSEAELASLLAFGTLFSATYKGSELYVDIRESNGNKRFLSLKEKTKLLPFVPEILIAGKEFAKQTIKGLHFFVHNLDCWTGNLRIIKRLHFKD